MNKGFTLIELLIVVALVIITVGVSSDIVVSLIRSYNKTRITNEIEQNANFMSVKLTNELKNATSVDQVTDSTIKFTIGTGVGNQRIIEYKVEYKSNGTANVGTVTRSVDAGSALLLTNNSEKGGIEVEIGSSGTPNFQVIQTNPYVIKLHFKLSEHGPSLSKAFTGNVTLDDTVVVRGTY